MEWSVKSVFGEKSKLGSLYNFVGLLVKCGVCGDDVGYSDGWRGGGIRGVSLAPLRDGDPLVFMNEFHPPLLAAAPPPRPPSWGWSAFS